MRRSTVRASVSDGSLDQTPLPQCPSCYRLFATGQGLNAHLSMAESCKWFRKGKNRELEAVLDDDTNDDYGLMEDWTEAGAAGFSDSGLGLDQNPEDTESWPPPWSEEDDADSDIDIISNEYVLVPQAGPGPTTRANRAAGRVNPIALDDDNDDTRYVVEHPYRGKDLFKT